MLIYHDADEYETVIHSHTCPFHRSHPGKAFAGCTCSAGWSQVQRSPEAIAKIKADRLRKEEDEILARAERIKAARQREASHD